MLSTLSQFDKVYQSAVSGVVNSPGKLPHSRKEYEDFLMTVSRSELDIQRVDLGEGGSESRPGRGWIRE